MQNPRSRDSEHDTGIPRCNRLWLVVQVWREQAMPVRTAAASIKAQKNMSRSAPDRSAGTNEDHRGSGSVIKK